jgi:hypothetical protein
VRNTVRSLREQLQGAQDTLELEKVTSKGLGGKITVLEEILASEKARTHVLEAELAVERRKRAEENEAHRVSLEQTQEMFLSEMSRKEAAIEKLQFDKKNESARAAAESAASSARISDLCNTVCLFLSLSVMVYVRS